MLHYYKAMGSPEDPTPAQVEELNRESALPQAQQTTLRDGKLSLTLTPNALVLIKVQP